MDKQDILDYLDAEVHPLVSPDHYDVYSNLHDMVSELPKVDAAPVIRCSECKHWSANTQFCAVFSGIGSAHRMPPNGYCSEAEKAV